MNPSFSVSSQIDEHSQNGSPNNLCESSGIKLLLTSRKRLSGNFIEEFSCHTVKLKNKKLNSSSSGRLFLISFMMSNFCYFNDSGFVLSVFFSIVKKTLLQGSGED